ncbi:MAG TPA: HD domain-containing phosphohydrolase [Burkholderiales bacterium]
MNDRVAAFQDTESDEARTRRAMLHILEDLQRERDAIRNAHEEWINTVDAVRDPMMVHDGECRIVRANRAYAERAGMSFQQLLGRPYWECFPKGDGPLPGCAPSELFAGGNRQPEQEFALPSGEIFVSRVFIVPRGSGERHALHLLEDVTEQKTAERRIRTLNTLYATLSAVNHAIVHSRTRHEIAERIVRISTEIGMFCGAWVGFIDPATGRMAPAAWSTSLGAYVDRLPASADYASAYFCNDIAADAATLPWRAFAESFGIHSFAAIPLQVDGAPSGVVHLYAKAREMFSPEVRALVLEMGDDITYALETLETERHRRLAESALTDNQAKLRRSLVATIEAIAATVETRDPYTAGHQRRVADLARAIGQEMGLGESALEGLHFGALIHDLGKLQVPAEILAKPTRLSKLEFELIKTHPQAGYDIVKGIDFPWPVAEMVRQHHERLDGSGYPQGLQGDAIAMEARILAVADVVEAMASHRPYRAGLGLDAALHEIEGKRGVWFDAGVVDACVRLFKARGFKLSGIS